jgi:hypothetical protein
MTLRNGPFGSRVLLGCVVFILAPALLAYPSQVSNGKHPQRQSAAKPRHQPLSSSGTIETDISGVEAYRPGVDLNDYNRQWEQMLTKEATTSNKKLPVVYDNKKNMAAGIIRALEPGECIRNLDLYGHGSPGYFGFGNSQGSDYVQSTYIDIKAKSPAMVREWKKELEELEPYFCAGAVLTLYGCHVGANDEGSEFLYTLSQHLGVRVRAPVNTVWAPYHYTGEMQAAIPQVKQRPKSRPITDIPYFVGLAAALMRPR